MDSNSNQPSKASQTEPASPPDRPEFQHPIQHSKKRLIIGGLIAGTLVGGAALAAGYWYFANRTFSPSSTSSSKESIAPNKTSTQAATNAAPPVAYASFGNVQAAYVTLPLTKDQTETNPLYGLPRTVVTAGGHYLVVDPKGITYGPKNLEGGNLIFDGNSIYNGPLLWQFVLSASGQHYAYMLDTSAMHNGGNIEIYLDGKQVQSVPDANGVYDLQVADNGTDYTYVTGKPKATWTDTDIVKDGRVIYTNPNGLRSLYFDKNLTHYIATTNPSSANKYDVIHDGTTIVTNGDFAGTIDPPVAISPNGSHYLYASGGTVYLDGKQILQPKDTAAMGVTDTGDYAIVNAAATSVTTSKKSYAIPSEFAQNCNPGCSGAFPEFAMSNDGLHVVFGTQDPNLWNLDGSAISPDGTIQSVDFVGDTLYMYRWADPSLVIKEWGIKIKMEDADKVTYTIGGNPNGSTANADGIISWATLKLNDTINTSDKCRILGYEAEQLTASTGAPTFGKYSYGFSGTYDPCGDSSVDPLRSKIISTELVNGAITTE